MTYYDNLDLILKYFHDKKTDDFESREQSWKNSTVDCTLNEFKILIEYLSDRLLVISDSVDCNMDKFKISLKGIEFYEDGGFKAKKRRLIYDKYSSYVYNIGTFLGGTGIFFFTAVQAYTSWLSVDKQDTKQKQQSSILKQSEISLIDSLVQVKILEYSLNSKSVDSN